jgi:imidazoleglycerol phosphate dehydratase HisB
MEPTPRTAEVVRKTNETDIKLSLNLDSKFDQQIDISTGIGFLDHVCLLACKNRCMTGMTHLHDIFFFQHRCIMPLPSMAAGP